MLNEAEANAENEHRLEESEMSIGEIIRKYRKEKQLTQEKMADCLGVTAPAVNKWENGNSFPDISLLAPIARLLGITTDTLLSYQEDLTDKEIDRFVKELNSRIKKEDFDAVFCLAMKKVKEYPNCDRLAFSAAQLLDSYRILMAETHSDQYDGDIYDLYRRSLDSSDRKIVESALEALFLFSLSREKYEEAQEYINRIPRQGTDPDRFQALLYDRQGKTAQAYELFERLLLSGYSDTSWALQGIYILAMGEGDVKKAEWIIQKQKKLAGILEMGKYIEASPGWDLAVHRKDKETALKILEDMICGMKELDAFKHSELYSHMKFSEHGFENIAFMFKKGFEDDESMDFLREDERYQALMKELKDMTRENGA
ncbi:helix-turn-helix transcriptional regulator [Lachnospiraceae bacterium 54-53]